MRQRAPCGLRGGSRRVRARLRAVEFDESLREYVLPRVLLNVVETSGPINTPAYKRARFRHAALDDVQHARFSGVNAINDARRAERARVRGLPAARRVEGRS